MIQKKSYLHISPCTWALGLILTVGFAVRAFGLNFYLPLHLHVDENNLFSKAFTMLQNGSLNPQYFRYPALLIYLQLIFYKLYLYVVSFLGSTEPVHLGNEIDRFYLIGRSLSVVSGTATIYVTYRIARKLFTPGSALFAALFLALTFIHVVICHYLSTDSLMILLGTLAYYYSLNLGKTGVRHLPWRYLLVGILIGLANATKYNPFYLLFLVHPFFYIFGWCEEKKDKIRHEIQGCCWALVGCGVAMMLCNPYMVVEFYEYAAGFASQVLLFNGNEICCFSDANGVATWKWWMDYLQSSGISLWMIVPMVIGWFLLFRNFMREDYLLLIFFPVIFCGFIFSTPHRMDRYIGPVLPFFAVYAGVALDAICRSADQYTGNRLVTRIMVRALACLIVFGWPAVKIGAFDYLITRKDTRLMAGEFVEEQTSKLKTTFCIAQGAPIGDYLNRRGYKAIGIHKKSFGNKEYMPFEGSTVMDYPGALVIVSRSDYYEAINNVNCSDVFSKFLTDLNTLKDQAVLLQEISTPLFRQAFFHPHRLASSATLQTYHHPTIEIYRIPDDRMLRYLSTTISGEELAKRSGIPAIVDQTAGSLSVAEVSLPGKAPAIGLRHFPFPSGRYRLSYEVKFSTDHIKEVGAFIVAHLSGDNAVSFGSKSIKNPQVIWQAVEIHFNLQETTRLELLFKLNGRGKAWIKSMRIERMAGPRIINE